MGDRIKPVISDQELFHVHTFRCRHAEEVPDRAYVEKALELGAKGIWFTDHCPFPGDLFKREHREFIVPCTSGMRYQSWEEKYRYEEDWIGRRYWAGIYAHVL